MITVLLVTLLIGGAVIVAAAKHYFAEHSENNATRLGVTQASGPRCDCDCK